jgi:hypothetical protein
MKTYLLLYSMDVMEPKLVLTTYEREWRNPVSGLYSEYPPQEILLYLI